MKGDLPSCAHCHGSILDYDKRLVRCRVIEPVVILLDTGAISGNYISASTFQAIRSHFVDDIQPVDVSVAC